MLLMPFSAEGVTPEMEAIAKNELGETPFVRRDSLEKLKRLIADEPNFYPYMNEQFLLMFLRHQKHNVEKAFNTLQNFYHFKEKYSRIFTDFLPSEHKEVMNMNCYSVLPYRDSQGRTLIVCTPARFKWQETSVDDFVALTLTVGLLGCKFDAVSICGWVIIFDARDFTMADFFKFACMKLLLFAFNSVQNCQPYRIKEIHSVNEPGIFRTIYNTAKYALPKKMRERVFLHGSNLEELHKYVSPEVLPKELGGALGPIDNTEYFKYALTQESVLEEMRNCGFKKRDTIKSQ